MTEPLRDPETSAGRDREHQHLLDEVRNFQDMAQVLKPAPGDIPDLPGVDIFGTSIPLHGIVGGDHLLYVDFNKRYDLDARIAAALAAGRPEIAEQLAHNRTRAGILVADVSGHRITDALLAAMLHQAFLLGAQYELDIHGEITTRLFEHVKSRFHQSSAVNKYITMIYGEISAAGTFRFLSAAHPPPVVFSARYGRIMPISADRMVTYSPIGMFPSATDLDGRRNTSLDGYDERYTVNEINLMGAGDILLLFSDGLSDHADGRYFPHELERCLAAHRERSAREICAAVEESLERFAPRTDDVTFVVIKKDGA